MPEAFPLDAYLARIGWERPLARDPATLVALHRHQTYAIPFENIDPFAGRPVSLEPENLFQKLITDGRGGYCFELNSLFLRALDAIGFATRSLCARTLVSAGNYGPRTHQVTLVRFGERHWLADVGFGGNGLIEAIPFELGREFDQGLDRFRLMADETFGYRLEHLLPTGWRANYAFSLDPYLSSDFRALNYFISRSPDSIFTRIPICVRTTPTARHIIVANESKTRSGNLTTAATLESAVDLRVALREKLGIPLPTDYPLPAPPSPPPGMREI